MSETAPEPPSGCVLFLVQATESMPPLRIGRALMQIDDVIDYLLKRYAPTIEQAAKIKVGVFGYSSDLEARKTRFIPLLPGTARSSDLLPLTALLKPADREFQRALLKPEGKPRAGAGLNHAYLLLHHWLAAHPQAHPLLVLHWGDGKNCDSAHGRAGRSLRILGTARGTVGLAHIVLKDGAEEFLVAPSSGVPPPLVRLFRHSSPVRLKGEGRALAVNSEPVPLVKVLLKQIKPASVLQPEGVSVRMRGLALAKRGNKPEEIEDAFALDEANGLAAVSDGASEGIFVRLWARLLSQSFVQTRFDGADEAKRAAWLAACRKVWLQEINFTKLRWSQQNRVDSVGGAATFLAWQLGKAPDGALAWRAWAVGDSCLFWIRKNRLRATFPLTCSRHFASAPWLLTTRTDISEPMPLFAAGRCEKDDLFLLATDALAQSLLRTVETNKPQPIWNELEMMAESAWQRKIERRRDRKKIVNDDCTMVAIRII